MSLSQYEIEKFYDDLKIIARIIKIIADENNSKKRNYAKLLACDMVDRLYRDILELKEGFIPISHDGNISQGE